MIDTIKFEVGKIYIIRGGFKARVIFIEAMHDQPVIALTLKPPRDREKAEHYSADGSYLFNGETTEYDIVAEWNPWLEVPVDTKIRVKENSNGRWEHRHFAEWDPVIEKVRAWDWGRTSHTSVDSSTAAWTYAEIVE
jgi:hypothetical protein